jgi:hypothetical protein
LLNTATGSIYKVNTNNGTVGAASAVAINANKDTIVLNNKDKIAYVIRIAAPNDTAFNNSPDAKSDAIPEGSYAGVRKTVAGRTNIHLYRLSADGFSEKSFALEKHDGAILISQGGTSIQSELQANPAQTALLLNAATTVSANKNNVSLSDSISTNITGNVTGNVSGSAATVTGAAQTAITSVGTLTALEVDNLSLDNDTITSSGALNLTPAVGSAVVLDGTINVDAGVVTGATSITSTTFVGALSGSATGLAISVNATGITANNQDITIDDGNYLSAVTGAAGKSINLTGTAVGQLVIVKEVGGAQPLSVKIGGGTAITSTAHSKTITILVTAGDAGLKLSEF